MRALLGSWNSSGETRPSSEVQRFLAQHERLPEATYAARVDLSFEALLADIGAQLLGAPLDTMDAAVSHALSRLVTFLEVDRVTIALPDPAGGTPRVTHSAAAVGVPRAPIGLSESELPWLGQQLRLYRKPIILSAAMELPPEGVVDLLTVQTHGMQSLALVPLTAGTRLVGVLSFGSAGGKQSWPSPLIDRLRLIAGIFAGAVLRFDHERTLHARRAEVKVLHERLQAEHECLRAGPLLAEGFDDIVGESPALRSVLFLAEQVAPTDTTVLLLGETGTGKELVARAIHAKSHRRDRPLVTVNCAALPSTLIESELFGHEKGAFTGATSRKLGRFELAHQGTLFLDELGELPLELQTKLLRVLQEGQFERLGSPATRTVDVRVIAASNRDLSAAARDGSFRADLYYRIGVFPIELPPLRARRQDIPLLVWHFLGQLGSSLGRKIHRVPAPTMDRLVAYPWPGNIRELRNVLERALILSPAATLLLDALAVDPRTALLAPAAAPRTLNDVERDHILRVLDANQWRVRGPGHAAQQLGLNASTLYSRMKKLGIRRPISHSQVGGGDPID